jgi:hypothetical protein
VNDPEKINPCQVMLISVILKGKSENKEMADSLKSRLLEVILLLLGVKFFTYTVSVVPFILPVESDFGRILIEIYPWIGRIIFALILLPQVWKISPKIAMAVSFLCAVEPVYGGIFYLIVTTSFQFKVDEWFIDLLD